MISEELASKVLGLDDIVHIQKEGKNEIFISRFNNHALIINIHNLEYICKEWAKDIGFSIVDGFDTIGEPICYIMEMTGYSQECYYEQTENYEDVFKACQWILDNKE